MEYRTSRLTPEDFHHAQARASARMSRMVKEAISRVAVDARERVERDGLSPKQAAREAAFRVMREASK